MAFQPTSNKHGSWLLLCASTFKNFQLRRFPRFFSRFGAWQSTMRPTSTEPGGDQVKLDIKNQDIYICLTFFF